MREGLALGVGLGLAAVVALVFGGLVLFARSGGFDTVPAEVLARYGGPPSPFVEIDGTRLHFRDDWRGPVLLLLNGLRASRHQGDGLSGQRDRQQAMIANRVARGGARNGFELAARVTAPVLIPWRAAGPAPPLEIQCEISTAFSAADLGFIVHPTLGQKLVMVDAVGPAADARWLVVNVDGPRACVERAKFRLLIE